ncbi:MAG TPA: hypothetical protein VIK91_18065 [Nannocystis sp.]
MTSAHNPIVVFVQELLAGLDEATRARVEASALEQSVIEMGAPLAIEDELQLLLAAKYLASADGVSVPELAGLTRVMSRLGLPVAAQRQVIEFDVSTVRPEHIGELAPPRSRPALYLLSSVAVLAALDGLSEQERGRARELGEHLGISPQLVDVILAEATLTADALRRKDSATLALLRPLRRAIYRML